MSPAQSKTDRIAVIGAGPYGLSVAAHLLAQGAPTAVFGEPLESWRLMPSRMFLKSVWSATSLADPAGAFSLDAYAAQTGRTPFEPIPLGFFLEYASWFQQQAVPEIDRVCVRSLSRRDGHFQLDLADGRSLSAARVVVAIGVRKYAHIPDFACGLPPQLASHTGDHVDLSRFKGSKVAVIGAGQSALENAAILCDEGAEVELIARGPVIWIQRRLYGHGSPLSRLLYPPSDVGPPVLNWLCAAPLTMRRLPPGLRHRIERRAARPAGAQWLRRRFVGRVRTTTSTSVVGADEVGGQVRLRLSDGTVREVDHVMLGTGYRPDVRTLDLLDPALREAVAEDAGFPVLNRWFESSVPGLHFVGGLAGRSFGPICRFVAGARIAAHQVAERSAELN